MNRNLFKWLAPLIFLFIIGCFYIVISDSLFLAKSLFGEEPCLNKTKLDIASRLGDSAGFINALFSALAFGGVLLTFYWQFMVDGKQHKATLQSQFENVFFNMTNTLNNIIEGLEFNIQDVQDIDDDSLRRYYHNGRVDSSGDSNQGDSRSLNVQGRKVFECWWGVFVNKARNGTERLVIFKDLMKGSLDHYFRYLYRILVYIDQSKLISEEEKYDYAAILRAQLSEYELLILFFNGLSNDGKHKAKPLFEKYSLFNNIREAELNAVGSLSIYVQNDEEDVSDTKYAQSAFRHVYTKKVSLCKLLFDVSLTVAAVVIVFCLIRNVWNTEVVGKLLTKIPSGNYYVLLLCVLGTVSIFINVYHNKRELFKGIMLKMYGNGDENGENRHLPYQSLIDRDYNYIALSAVMTLVIVTKVNPYKWHGCCSIPYIVIIGASAFADLIASLFFIRYAKMTKEELLNILADLFVPVCMSLKRWYRIMKARYDRLRNETPIDEVAASPIPVNNTEEAIIATNEVNNATGGSSPASGAVFMAVSSSEGVEDGQNEDIEESENQQQ